MSMANIYQHPTVAHYLRFVATTVGRDKVLRAIQYFARFYSWYLLRTNATTAAIEPWTNVKKNFGLIRKGMRVGKNIEHLKSAAVAYESKTLDPVIKYLAVGRQLGYAVYLSLDAVTFVDAIKFRPIANVKQIQKNAYRGWMAGLTFSAISGIYTLYQLKLREAQINNSKEKDGESVVDLKRLQRERTTATTQLTSDVLDLFAPLAALEIIGFDEGAVGLAGTTSSIIGLMNQWRKTAV